MKYVTVLISLVSLFVLAGCGAADPAPATPTTEVPATATAPAAEPTEASPQETPEVEAYPAAPEPTATPSDYPAAPAPVMPTGYPADMTVWMQLPWGIQCEDVETYEYADVAEAVAALEDAGVTVQASEMVELAVCQACDCPTPEHFRVQISAQDMEQAQALGWTRQR